MITNESIKRELRDLLEWANNSDDENDTTYFHIEDYSVVKNKGVNFTYMDVYRYYDLDHKDLMYHVNYSIGSKKEEILMLEFKNNWNYDDEYYIKI